MRTSNPFRQKEKVLNSRKHSKKTGRVGRLPLPCWFRLPLRYRVRGLLLCGSLDTLCCSCLNSVKHYFAKMRTSMFSGFKNRFWKLATATVSGPQSRNLIALFCLKRVIISGSMEVYALPDGAHWSVRNLRRPRSHEEAE